MKSLKILIAEDDTFTAMSLAKSLEKLGHNVIGRAKNGSQAVDLVKSLKPELIIMDIQMDYRDDGINAARQIMRIQPTPILYLSALTYDENLVRSATETGVTTYITKPVTNLDLLRINLQVALDNFQRLQPAQTLIQGISSVTNRDITTRINNPDILPLYIFTLGRFAIQQGEREITDFRDPTNKAAVKKAKAIFAYLIYRLGHEVTRDELIDSFWGDENDSSNADNNLSKAISAIKRTLEPTISARTRSRYFVSERSYYRLDPGLITLDCDLFTQLIQQGDAGTSTDTENAMLKYTEALSYYQGEWMKGVPFADNWREGRKQDLLTQFKRAKTFLAEKALREEKSEKTIQLYHDIINQDPYDRVIHLKLMQLYISLGRIGDMLKQKEIFERRLGDIDK